MSTPSHLASTLLESLKSLDQSSRPLGLYACHDLDPQNPPAQLYTEWRLAFRPALSSLGATNLKSSSPFEYATGLHPAIGAFEILIRRIAGIRVQQRFGKRLTDHDVDVSDRWQRSSLTDALSAATYRKHSSKSNLSVVLLIAFSENDDPFADEIAALHRQTARFETSMRIWQDEEQRGFYIRTQAWWKHHAEA